VAKPCGISIAFPVPFSHRGNRSVSPVRTCRPNSAKADFAEINSRKAERADERPRLLNFRPSSSNEKTRPAFDLRPEDRSCGSRDSGNPREKKSIARSGPKSRNVPASKEGDAGRRE